jgi:hypothetical protein
MIRRVSLTAAEEAMSKLAKKASYIDIPSIVVIVIAISAPMVVMLF